MDRPSHRFARSALAVLMITLAAALPGAPAAAKEGYAPAWIASGSQPLPAGCAPFDPMMALATFFQAYDAGDTAAIQRQPATGTAQHPIVIPGHFASVGVIMRSSQLVNFVAQRHAQHDRFVLLQVVVSQGDHPWLDVTFDAFREADDFPGKVVGGTGQFDCQSKTLLGLNIGNDELIAAPQPPTIAMPAAPPTAAACTVAPVPDSALPGIAHAVTTAPWRWATTYGPGTAGARLVPDDYPAIPGLIATVQELLGCYRAHDFGRAAALFSPVYFAHAPQATEALDLAIPRLLHDLAAPPVTPGAALDPTLKDMGSVQLLPDGRIAAWLTISGTASPVYQEVVFVKSGDRWLIEGAYPGP